MATFKSMLHPAKPSTFEVWQRWAKALQRQYTLVAAVYKKHDQKEKAAKIDHFLERLGLFIDPVAHAHELAQKNFRVQGSTDNLRLLALTMLEKLFREALHDLPGISDDMRELLDSSCYGECNGREATDIFKGPFSNVGEGIGSGISDERGGLPWSLMHVLEEATVGGDEYFKRGLNQDAGNHASADEPEADGPTRHTPSRSVRGGNSGGIE